jgi:hypothetical protein
VQTFAVQKECKPFESSAAYASTKLQQQYICKRDFSSFAESVFAMSFDFNRIHSPGFCPAFSRSSSSNACNTADFASAAARVIDGSSKLMLKKKRKILIKSAEELETLHICTSQVMNCKNVTK